MAGQSRLAKLEYRLNRELRHLEQSEALSEKQSDEVKESRNRCETCLSDFVQETWGILEPETLYAHNWHIDCISDYLGGVASGHITRLVINMPPRTLKSRVVTVAWPDQLWTTKPWLKFIMASYAAPLAESHSLDRREIIQSDWYVQRWGKEFGLNDDQNTKSYMRNDRGGQMLSVGVGGVGIGFGADILIIDDANDPEKAESDTQLKRVIRQFRLKLSRRLNDKKKSAIVMVQQRVSAKDLSGVALEMGYTHLCLEGVSPKRRFILLPSSLPHGKKIECDCTICMDERRKVAAKAQQPPPAEEVEPAEGRYYEREKGEFLQENREGADEHAQARIELGSAGYAGQYQQRPTPEGGGKFKRLWFSYFKDAGDYYELHPYNKPMKRVLKSLCRYFATADTAMTEDKAADYTAIGIWATTPEGDLLLLQMIREQVEDPDVERIIVGLLTSGRVPYVGVEKKANGTALIQRLVRQGKSIRAIEAETDKVSRASTAAVDMENGKILFLANAPWLVEYEQELENFPNGAHDDQVDATSYAAIQRARDLVGVAPDGEVGQYAG